MSKKKNEVWKMGGKFTQPYNSDYSFDLPTGGFNDEAVRKLLEISDGDMQKLDEWIAEQLAELEAEIAADENVQQELAELEVIDMMVEDMTTEELSNVRNMIMKCAK